MASLLLRRDAYRQVERRRFRLLWANRLVCLAALVAAFGVTSFQVSAEEKPLVVVAFGDSLTAGYRLRPSQSLPSQLEAALKAAGRNVRVINAGVSGDTTGAGLSRFDWAVPSNADAVILGLGANDALRGLPVADANRNLTAILDRLKEKGLPVLLAGFPSPSNWGDDYQVAFADMFPALASKYGTVYYPNLLHGVAMDPKLNLDDGLHPNADGIAVIVERIMPSVLKLLDRTADSKSG
ncbi:MAG: arylesterase [Pseudomonadota bacterium]